MAFYALSRPAQVRLLAWDRARRKKTEKPAPLTLEERLARRARFDAALARERGQR